METRKCRGCQQILNKEEFYKVDWKRKIGLCKKCRAKLSLQRYNKKKQYVDDIKTECGCFKCGYNKIPDALELHHIDPSIKELDISHMTSCGYSNDKIDNEINKCIVLCALCHREFHWYQYNYNINLQQFLNSPCY